jgi:hypothetical protein
MVNFTGIALPALKVRRGWAKLPPVASAPAIGARKPLNVNGGLGIATAKKVPPSSVIFGVLVSSKYTANRPPEIPLSPTGGAV